MSQQPIIYEGFILMGLGMGFVFFFLCLLVGAIHLLSKASALVLPAKTETTTTKAPECSTSSEDNVIAAITAAIHHHKKLNAKSAQI
ncbi:OadG family protein [Vibrio atypicus]|jgi:oxaloacetate decarboxylase gamma subunit|uniref:OadG family protein n=1 Tax=Vibrio atypicus TaxID=558271 RepID=UPI0013587EE0|nr:OadG family transporter subunit [Vibrio atypicus]